MKAFSTRTRRWTSAVFSGLLVLGLTTIGQAEAGGGGGGGGGGENPKCVGYDFGYKWESPNGTITIDRDGLVMTLTVGTYDDASGHGEPNPRNAVLSYSVSGDVTTGQIIVKGGPGANTYSFGASTPLHAPVNPENGKWPTISHVQVCWDEPEEPEYGRIELTKAVTGADAPTGIDFEVCIDGPQPEGTQQCELIGAGETASFENLEPGTYAVTETDPGADWTVAYSDETLTVEAGATDTATIVNVWVPEEPEGPEYGRVALTKVVTGTGAPTGTVFTLCITGPDTDDTPQCRLVTGGQTALFENLEPGTYAVTETDPGVNWTITYSDDELTVQAGETGVATVTNAYVAQQQAPPVPPTDVSPSGGSVAPSSGALPTTGTSTLAEVGVATALLAVGGLLLRTSRRARRVTS